MTLQTRKELLIKELEKLRSSRQYAPKVKETRKPKKLTTSASERLTQEVLEMLKDLEED